ncbi:MAG: thiamine phosphate synthase [Balneolaceae bacterium]|nr:thiamine phosphate synthase [Balneolaceae bacterium]
MNKKVRSKKIISGVYLVLDPSVQRNVLMDKLKEALQGGIDIIQIWNHWPDSFSADDKEQVIDQILSISNDYNVPVLINEDWELLKDKELDGIHFDHIPDHFSKIKTEVEKDFIAGITCSNDLDVIRWADENNFDYISFCSMFPSSSVDSCEIVRLETVRKAREITELPLFVSGGITTENLPELEKLDFEGVAVISGILNSDSPRESTNEYKELLHKMNKET